MMACSGRVDLTALAQASLTFVTQLRVYLDCVFNQLFLVLKQYFMYYNTFFTYTYFYKYF